MDETSSSWFPVRDEPAHTILTRIDKNLARLLAIFEYLHRDICDELDRKDTR